MRGKNSFLLSSDVNEVTGAVLNFFIFFFLQKDFTRTNSTKSIQANKKEKRQRFLCP